MQIEINANSVCFKNALSSNEIKGNNSSTNFGLGLSLVHKLCQRFDLFENIEINDKTYSIEIGIP